MTKENDTQYTAVVPIHVK